MYRWDLNKSRNNEIKHDIKFSDAVIAFEDDRAMTIQDNFNSEERFITIGCDAYGRILVVVYSQEQNVIRIISARKANKKEREAYEKTL